MTRWPRVEELKRKIDDPDYQVTYGDTCGVAMEIEDQNEADAFLVQYIRSITQDGKTAAEALSIARQNIGYWTGYCDSETAARAMRLFKCSHPVFGTTRPTTKKAFETGKRMAGQQEGKCQ